MSGLDGFGWSVLAAAVGVGAVHTVLGPDHYLPFVMLARARRWSPARAVAIAAGCGAGHVAASVLVGTLGLALGWSVGRLDALEEVRGSAAAWVLTAFGTAYAAWGVRRAYRRRHGIVPHAHHGHVHVHAHGDHEHTHGHHESGRATFWTLFAVFVLGPCEPLVPLFILPASRGQWALATATATVFGAVTIACMAILTAAGMTGWRRLPLGPLERWSHALAGAVIAVSGLSVIAWGL